MFGTQSRAILDATIGADGPMKERLSGMWARFIDPGWGVGICGLSEKDAKSSPGFESGWRRKGALCWVINQEIYLGWNGLTRLLNGFILSAKTEPETEIWGFRRAHRRNAELICMIYHKVKEALDGADLGELRGNS